MCRQLEEGQPKSCRPPLAALAPASMSRRSFSEDTFDDFSTLEEVPSLTVHKELRQLKVLCVSVPEAGHLVPTMNVAVALAVRKHRVELSTCAWAGPKVQSACSQSGVQFVGLAPDVKAAESGQGPAAEHKAADRMASMFMVYNDAMHEPLMAHARSGTQLFLLGTLSLPGTPLGGSLHTLQNSAPMSLVYAPRRGTQT